MSISIILKTLVIDKKEYINPYVPTQTPEEY